MSTTAEQVLTKVTELGKINTEGLEASKKEIARLQERVEYLEALGDRPKGGGSRNSAEEKTFLDYIRGDKGALQEISQKEMSIGGGAASGQALVPEFIANEIMEYALAQSQITRRVKRTSVTTSDYVRLLNIRGQAAAWSSETGTRSGTNNFLLRERRPTHGELYALVTVTNWLLQDSKFDLSAMIRDNAAAQFAKALDAAVYNGDGSNKPTGIFNGTPVLTDDSASPQRSAEVIEYVATSGDIANDMIDLFFTLAPEYRQNATFAMSSPTLGVVRQQRDTNGSTYLWPSSLGDAMDAPDGRLVGKPVVTWEDLPSINNSPLDFSVMCGDFGAGYEITEIGPMSVLLDPYSVKGKTDIYIYQRFGGIIIDNNAIKCLQA